MKEYIVAGYYRNGKFALCSFIEAGSDLLAVEIFARNKRLEGVNIFKVL